MLAPLVLPESSFFINVNIASNMGDLDDTNKTEMVKAKASVVTVDLLCGYLYLMNGGTLTLLPSRCLTKC
jgi:hypothetical protein